MGVLMVTWQINWRATDSSQVYQETDLSSEALRLFVFLAWFRGISSLPIRQMTLSPLNTLITYYCYLNTH